MRNKAIQVYIYIDPLHIALLKDLQRECTFIYWEKNDSNIELNDEFPERNSIIQALING